MAGERVTLTVDQALDVFYLATLYVELTGSLDQNQIAAYESMAAKLDFQLGGRGVCQESAAEALEAHRGRREAEGCPT